MQVTNKSTVILCLVIISISFVFVGDVGVVRISFPFQLLLTFHRLSMNGLPTPTFYVAYRSFEPSSTSGDSHPLVCIPFLIHNPLNVLAVFEVLVTTTRTYRFVYFVTLTYTR